jgi:hypothetical protein
VFGNKGSGYHDIEARLGPTLGNSLARSVDLTSSHERACSEMSTRACRASRLRCFRKIAPSLISVARLRSRPAYSRSAARISAVRLCRRRGDFSDSSSKSFDVSSSMAIFFIQSIISVTLDYAQAFILWCKPARRRFSFVPLRILSALVAEEPTKFDRTPILQFPGSNRDSPFSFTGCAKDRGGIYSDSSGDRESSFDLINFQPNRIFGGLHVRLDSQRWTHL